MYSIGTFSKLTKTTIAALRFYDKEGLLKPAYTDSKSGYRYYLSSQLVTVQKILSLRQIGIPIEQIKIMINTNDEQYQLEKYQQELRNSIMETQKKINIIQIMLDGEYPYDVFIKELDECIVYSRIARIDSNLQLYDFIQSTEKKIFAGNPKLKTISPITVF